MVSDFLTPDWGRLLDEGPDGVIESVYFSEGSHCTDFISCAEKPGSSSGQASIRMATLHQKIC